MATLYDFHAAAKHNMMAPGSVRIFLLSDISKAFDRAQVDVMLHALRCIVNVPGIERLLARISHLYSVGKIAVTKNGITVLVDKLGGGVPRGPHVPSTLHDPHGICKETSAPQYATLDLLQDRDRIQPVEN